MDASLRWHDLFINKFCVIPAYRQAAPRFAGMTKEVLQQNRTTNKVIPAHAGTHCRFKKYYLSILVTPFSPPNNNTSAPR